MRLIDHLIMSISAKMWAKMEWTRWYTLLRVDYFRELVVAWRKRYFIERQNALRVWDGDNQRMTTMKSGLSTIEHNLEGLHDIRGTRGLRIIRPLSVIETYRPLSIMPAASRGYDQDYISTAMVLDIGPRTEGELFSLMAYGFRMPNIRGLDLISYSPMIDLGDMHAMPYQDNTFDIAIASCVLVYSTDPKKACNEMVRVTKAGGLICISQDTIPETGIAAVGALGKQLNRIDDYLELFAPHVDRIFFSHELPDRLKPINLDAGEGSNYTTGLIFSIKKAG